MTDRTTDAQSSGVGGFEATVRTFLLADFRGYTRFTREQGDDAASSLAARFAALVRETVPLFGGELLELRGDEALCVFGSARQGLRAAVELQRRLRTPAPDGWVFPLGVGMGLDAGEAVPTEGGYRGAALNMAGRLVALAGPGEILATERLAGLASRVDGVRWGAPKSVRLKGLERPERIVRVTSDQPLPPPPRPPAARPVRRLMIAGIVLAVAAVGGLALLIGRSNRDSAPQVAAQAQSLVVIDANQGRVVADVALPDHPESLAVGAGRVWVGLAGGSVAPVRFGASHADAPIGTAYEPAFLAYGAGAVWAFDPRTEHLTEIDPRQGVIASRHLWHCPPSGPNKCGGGGVAVVGDEVWVGRASGSFYDVHAGSLYRVHASDLSTAGEIRHVAIGLLSANHTQAWTFGNHGVEADGLNIAPPHNIYHQQLPEEDEHTFSSSFGGLALGFGDAWVGAPRGNLYRLRTDGSLLQSNLGGGINAVATSSSAVWVALSNGTVLKVSPATGHALQRFQLGHTPAALAASGSRVWVALA